MKLLITVMTALVMSTPANAAKPKRAVAQAVATKWVKAMVKAQADTPATFSEAAKLTSANVRVAVFDGTSSQATCEVTATGQDKINDALACAKKGPIATPLKPYSAKVLRSLWGWMKQNKAEIEKVAKTHEVFVFFEQGEDIAQIAIVAVGLDEDKVARVAVVFASELTS